MKSVDIVPFVRGWDSGDDEKIALFTRAIVSSVVARAQRRDGLWFALAADVMGVPESVLRSHAANGNDLSLAILIHVVRQQYSIIRTQYSLEAEFSRVLEAASKFDVLDTSPELQHEFCALWNEVTRGATLRLSWYLLRMIRNVYLTLHLHTDCAPTQFSASTSDEDDILMRHSTYPLCNIPGHHPHPAAHIHDVSASTSTPRHVLHDNAELDPTFPPYASSLSVTTPVLADENTVDVPQIDNILVSAPSSSCALQTATETFHDSTTSPNLTAAVDTRDNPSALTMAPTILAASTLTTSVPPPAGDSLQNDANLLAPRLGSPEIPFSTPPEPGLENIPLIGTPPTLTIPCPNLTSQCVTQNPVL